MRPLLLLVLLLAGCASMASRELTTQELEAVRLAEAFVLRNGYTAAGHPANLPVQRVSIFDVLESDDELINGRKGLLEQHAIAIEHRGDDTFWVYFPEAGRKDSPRIVLVSGGEALQLFHQSYGPPSKEAVPVASVSAPPNNSFKPNLLRRSA